MNIEVSKQAKLPTTHGEFIIQSFKEGIKEHLVIFTKTLDETPMVRIHSECLTGDAIGSIKCDCQAQLNYALDFINEHNGMVIYLRQEGRDGDCEWRQGSGPGRFQGGPAGDATWRLQGRAAPKHGVAQTFATERPHQGALRFRGRAPSA